MTKRRTSVRAIARAEKTAQKKFLDAKAKGNATSDSFQNFVAKTGIGTNNVSTGSQYGFNPITNFRVQLEWMYRGSWICGVAVDAVADDMTRAGVELSSTMDPKNTELMNAAIQRWMIWPRLNDAIKWGRLYGGAIAVLLIDGQDVSTPLRIDTIGKGQFRGLHVFDRWMVDPSLEDLVTDMGVDIGMPKFYRVNAEAPALRSQRVHHSRVVRCDGLKQPYWQALTLNLWGLSVLEPLYDRLVAFDSTTQGAAQLVYKAYLRTMKVSKLREIIALGGPAFDALVQQMAVTRTFQVNEGLTLIDAEDEFETHAYSFSGLDTVLLQFGQQLSGATQIPLTRLFGQSPAGLSATGESDLRNYYDGVNQKQELKLRHPLDTIFRVMARSEGIALPDNFGYAFRPLWQLTAKEKAEVAKTTTDTVLAAKEANLVSDATALREMRNSSYETGIWTNITDEDINNADQEPASPEQMIEIMKQETAAQTPPAANEDIDPAQQQEAAE